FAAITELLKEVATAEHGRPPTSIVLLSGDVHHCYLAEVGFPIAGWPVRRTSDRAGPGSRGGWEAARRLEALAHEAVGALERPLGLGVASRKDPPADRELTAEGGKALARATAPGVDRALAVPDERLGQRAEPFEVLRGPLDRH
ncbi:MAG: hypothetical protein LC808_07905, partial [Actinobacteria bacterium]|nr:hypothetical protein [Actinomycetota bacterium]